KYSYANTEIRVSAHVESDRFSLRISNVGFEIRAEDIPRLRKRGERGEKAQLATGQGAGLGWWLVDNIIKGHGGELEVIPTNSEGRSEVRLHIPAPRSRRS